MTLAEAAANGAPNSPSSNTSRPRLRRQSLPANPNGFSEPPGAVSLLSGRFRSALGMAKAGARLGSSNRNASMHGACGSACGPLNRWGDTCSDVARSIGLGACSPSFNDPIVRATPPIGSFRWRLLSFLVLRRPRTISRFDHLHRPDRFGADSGPSCGDPFWSAFRPLRTLPAVGD